MNTKLKIACLLSLLLLELPGWAQFSPPTDTTGGKRGAYHVVLTVGGGGSVYRSAIGIPPAWQNTEANYAGTSFTVRALWHPDHRFRTGLETGLTTFYSYKGTINGEAASVRVSAIPILLIYQMPLAWHTGTERSLLRRVAVTAGLGAYLIRSQLTYKGTVNSQEISAGWLGGVSYTQPLTNSLRLAAEVRWLNPTATRESDFAVQAQVLWRVLSW
ncbi:hypothetical protein [Fibrella aquatilis]|uniref:Outer membrane protein beta-barrel domain-containing protein n=1 Tax=Fibrella aquatilis TaxID=2817059 RepID=A0A939K2W2_9BACT|nr:hypothetical protein [Fibrella aquatilis]MBO0933730.1 hypothetical protein [Fibrella aquatilis]